MEDRTYEYELSENHICCAIRIYNKNALDELHIHLELSEKGKTQMWVIILVVVLGIAMILGFIYVCCKRPKKSLAEPDNGPDSGKVAAATCCLAGCLCAWCMARIMTSQQ